MYALLLIFPILFFSSNSDFFEQVEKDTAKGAVWKKIPAKSPDPNAKSIPLQCWDFETDTACGEPYVIYKLVMTEDK